MSTQRWEPPADPDQPALLEIEDWAARERQRREAWLSGPTADQKAAWARRERERRTLEREARNVGGSVRESSRFLQRYVREMQLAAEGAMSLLLNTAPTDVFGNLVRAGRDWEDEFTSQPPRRRRVKLDADGPASRPARTSEKNLRARPERTARSVRRWPRHARRVWQVWVVLLRCIVLPGHSRAPKLADPARADARGAVRRLPRHPPRRDEFEVPRMKAA